jgi:LacI family transcriptional regulator
MTVSRVLNRSGYVSPDARERVEAAVADLGYVPNYLARSLRSNQTGTIALVLSDITNPFFTTLARGVEDGANAAGTNVILCNTDESEAKQASYLELLVQKRVDGVLLVPAASAPKAVLYLQQRRVPVVVLDRRIPHCTVDCVRCDSEDGAYRLTRLLIGLGHTAIALVNVPAGVSTAQDRLAGYRRALDESGLPFRPGLVCSGPFTQDHGRRGAAMALEAAPTPTALFAANNFIAIGAYRALRDAGRRIPDDVALVAFDDLPPALVMEPFLTVAAQPAYAMGRQAIELLMRTLAEGAGRPSQEIVLPTEIIVRDSLGSGPEAPARSIGSPGRIDNSVQQCDN